MKRLVVGFTVVVVGLAGLLTWKLKQQENSGRAPPVSPGVVEETRFVIASRLASRIVAIHAREGDKISANTLVVELDCREQDAAVAGAEARKQAAQEQIRSMKAKQNVAHLQAKAARRTAEGQVAQAGSLGVQGKKAQRDNERASKLFKEKVVDEATVDTARSAVDDMSERLTAAQASAAAAQWNADALDKHANAFVSDIAAAERQVQAVDAELSRARTQQGECKIVAPQNGVITVRAHEPGEVVLPGSTLLELRAKDKVKIKFFVRNGDLGKVKLGSRVQVAVDAFPGEQIAAHVTWISEEAEFTPRNVQTRGDRERLVYAAEATPDTPDSKLRSGLPVDVSVVAE